MYSSAFSGSGHILQFGPSASFRANITIELRTRFHSFQIDFQPHKSKLPALPSDNPSFPLPGIAYRLTVGLLETGTGTRTTELLGLATTVVGNEEGTVVLGKSLLEHVLAVLIDVLLVVGDQGLGDGLTDGVDLRSVTTSGDADANVCKVIKSGIVPLLFLFISGWCSHTNGGELVKTNDEQGLVDLLFQTPSVMCSFPLIAKIVSISNRPRSRPVCRMSPTFSSSPSLYHAKTCNRDYITDLETEDGRLNKLKGLAVDLDCSNLLVSLVPSFHPSCRILGFERTEALALLGNGDSGGGPLLAEASDALGGGRHCHEVLSSLGVSWTSLANGRWRRDKVAVMFCG